MGMGLTKGKGSTQAQDDAVANALVECDVHHLVGGLVDGVQVKLGCCRISNLERLFKPINTLLKSSKEAKKSLDITMYTFTQNQF